MSEGCDSNAEQITYWQDTELDGVEVLHVNLRDHVFERHAHEGYATSVIDRGEGSFWYRGQRRYAPAGSVVLLDPEQAHTGEVVSEEGWSYRILYPRPDLLQRVAEEAFGEKVAYHFPEPVVRDRTLALCMDRLHRALSSGAPALERESVLVSTYATLLSRFAEPCLRDDRPVGREPDAVALAREYLEECYVRGPSLEELSEEAGLSRYHLVRVFGEAVGMPPHAYLTQVRLRRARELLSAGVPAGVAARRVGFADQSHLTRRFKGFFGITPGRFARWSTA